MAKPNLLRFHHVLKARITGGEISIPITRAEAAVIIKKWSAALKRTARGHRTYFIMTTHKGRCVDRLVVETHAHRARRGLEAEATRHWITR